MSHARAGHVWMSHGRRVASTRQQPMGMGTKCIPPDSRGTWLHPFLMGREGDGGWWKGHRTGGGARTARRTGGGNKRVGTLHGVGLRRRAVYRSREVVREKKKETEGEKQQKNRRINPRPALPHTGSFDRRPEAKSWPRRPSGAYADGPYVDEACMAARMSPLYQQRTRLGRHIAHAHGLPRKWSKSRA